MKLQENTSKQWYKILDYRGRPIDGEDLHWLLPQGPVKGEWVETSFPLGTILVSNPKHLLRRDHRAFIAELGAEPMAERPGVVWVRRARLVREATNMDLKRFGIHRAFELVPESINPTPYGY